MARSNPNSSEGSIYIDERASEGLITPAQSLAICKKVDLINRFGRRSVRALIENGILTDEGILVLFDELMWHQLGPDECSLVQEIVDNFAKILSQPTVNKIASYISSCDEFEQILVTELIASGKLGKEAVQIIFHNITEARHADKNNDPVVEEILRNYLLEHDDFDTEIADANLNRNRIDVLVALATAGLLTGKNKKYIADQLVDDPNKSNPLQAVMAILNGGEQSKRIGE